MDPFFGFSSLPTWAGIALLLSLVAMSVLAPLYVRKRVSLERLVLNNEVAGFKYATLGVIYAVLLGSAVVTIWEMYEESENSVISEASVLDAMYRLGEQLPQDMRGPILRDLRAYVNAAVQDEWPSMAAGQGGSPKLDATLERLYVHYRDATSGGASSARLIDKSLDLLIRLDEIRRERLDDAQGTLPTVLGVALVVGAALTVGFTLFFGAPNVLAQAAMTGIICLMVMLALFAAVMLNYPFSGDISVSSRPLQELLAGIAPGQGATTGGP